MSTTTTTTTTNNNDNNCTELLENLPLELWNHIFNYCARQRDILHLFSLNRTTFFTIFRHWRQKWGNDSQWLLPIVSIFVLDEQMSQNNFSDNEEQLLRQDKKRNKTKRRRNVIDLIENEWKFERVVDKSRSNSNAKNSFYSRNQRLYEREIFFNHTHEDPLLLRFISYFSDGNKIPRNFLDAKTPTSSSSSSKNDDGANHRRVKLQIHYYTQYVPWQNFEHDQNLSQSNLSQSSQNLSQKASNSCGSSSGPFFHFDWTLIFVEPNQQSAPQARWLSLLHGTGLTAKTMRFHNILVLDLNRECYACRCDRRNLRKWKKRMKRLNESGEMSENLENGQNLSSFLGENGENLENGQNLENQVNHGQKGKKCKVFTSKTSMESSAYLCQIPDTHIFGYMSDGSDQCDENGHWVHPRERGYCSHAKHPDFLFKNRENSSQNSSQNGHESNSSDDEYDETRAEYLQELAFINSYHLMQLLASRVLVFQHSSRLLFLMQNTYKLNHQNSVLKTTSSIENGHLLLDDQNTTNVTGTAGGGEQQQEREKDVLASSRISGRSLSLLQRKGYSEQKVSLFLEIAHATQNGASSSSGNHGNHGNNGQLILNSEDRFLQNTLLETIPTHMIDNWSSNAIVLVQDYCTLFNPVYFMTKFGYYRMSGREKLLFLEEIFSKVILKHDKLHEGLVKLEQCELLVNGNVRAHLLVTYYHNFTYYIRSCFVEFPSSEYSMMSRRYYALPTVQSTIISTIEDKKSLRKYQVMNAFRKAKSFLF